MSTLDTVTARETRFTSFRPTAIRRHREERSRLPGLRQRQAGQRHVAGDEADREAARPRPQLELDGHGHPRDARLERDGQRGRQIGPIWSRLKFWIENFPPNEVGVRSMSWAENSTGESLSAACTARLPTGPERLRGEIAGLDREVPDLPLAGRLHRAIGDRDVGPDQREPIEPERPARLGLGRSAGGDGAGAVDVGEPGQDVGEVELGRAQAHQVHDGRGEPQLGDADVAEDAATTGSPARPAARTRRRPGRDPRSARRNFLIATRPVNRLMSMSSMATARPVIAGICLSACHLTISGSVQTKAMPSTSPSGQDDQPALQPAAHRAASRRPPRPAPGPRTA